MKRILLEIENYLSYFWVSLSILFAMAVYLMWRLPIFIWFGANHQTNFFGSSLYETENFYPLILFYALLPLAIIFLALSLFIWLYYRGDKIVSKVGFKNIIIGVFAIFLLFLLPTQAYFTSQEVRECQNKQAEESAQSRKGYVKSPSSSFEILKLYQSLADDGIQPWRTNPLAVAQSEIKEGGVLHRFSRPDNNFILRSESINETSGRWAAVVELENDYHDVEIFLSKHLRQDKSGIWRIKKYIDKR